MIGTINFKLQCPSEAADAIRLSKAIAATKALFPRLDLNYTTPKMKSVFIEDMETCLKDFVANNAGSKTIHNNKRPPELVTIGIGLHIAFHESFKLKNKSLHPLSASVSIHIMIPFTEIYINKSFDLMKIWGEATSAYNITADPDNMESSIREIINYDNTPEFIAPYGLPSINVKLIENRNRPLIFSWINYWSPESSALVGITEADKKYFYKAEQLKNGGWVLQLTQEPLDINIPEHLTKLQDAYSRFQKVGGQDLLQ